MAEILPAERRPLHGSAVLPASSGRPQAADYYELPQAGIGEAPIKEYLRALRRHLWLILGVTALTGGFTAYTLSKQRPVYGATASIRITDVRGAMTGGIGAEVATKQMGYSDPIRSQIQVIQSRSLAAEVADKVGLRLRVLTPDFPAGLLRDVQVAPTAEAGDTLRLAFARDGVSVRGRQGTMRAAYGQPVEIAGVRFVVGAIPQGVDGAELLVLSREQAAGAVLGGLRATSREGTDVVDLRYTAHDPRVAQQVVNAVATTFQMMNATAAQRESRVRRQFMEGRLKETEAELTKAQRQLANFRSRTRVYSSAQQMAAQQQVNLDLRMRREELVAKRQVYQGLVSQARRGGVEALGASPEVAENPVMAADFQRLSQYKAARDSLTTGPWRRAATHPDVERLEKLISQTQGRIGSAAQTQSAVLNGQIAAIGGVEARGSAEIQALPRAEEEEVVLVQRAEGISKMYEQLREEHQKARIAEEVEAGQVEVVDLSSAASQVPSGRPIKLLLSIVLGLMVGGSGALLLEFMNTSIRRREEIENVLQIPGLAVIPQIAASGGNGASRLRLPGARGNGKALTRSVGGGSEGLVAASQMHSSGAEAYRTLRTNLIFSQAVQTLKTIVVTSASPGEGKTTTAANLAVTFAQQGMQVLLVDCDLRRARLHKMFGIPREPGLTEVMLDQGDAAEVAHKTAVDGLSVLSSGTLPPNPSELLGGARMERVLEELRERFDVIILDSPPLLAASDAAVLGTKTDGVLLVVRAGQTERGAAQQAVQQLANVGARVVGAVLNDPDAKVPQYGGYYNYEYYGDES